MHGNPRDPYKCNYTVQRGLFQVLVSARCDIQHANEEKDTALHYAARHGHRECVELLLARNADIESKTVWGYTPLLLAVMNGCSEAALTLIRAGANVCVRERARRTILHFAARKNLQTVLESAIDLGADVDATDSDGNSPMFEALIHHHFQSLMLLIVNGCSVQVVGRATIEGKFRWCTPLELAVHSEQLAACKLIFAAGSNFSDFLNSSPNSSIPNVTKSEIKEWLQTVTTRPRRLVDIVRITVREQLGKKLKQKVGSLPLLVVLREFLSYR